MAESLVVEGENGKSSLGRCQVCHSRKSWLWICVHRREHDHGKSSRRGPGGALGSELSGGICNLTTSDACVTGCPPYLDRRARKEQGGGGFEDVEERGLVSS